MNREFEEKIRRALATLESWGRNNGHIKEGEFLEARVKIGSSLSPFAIESSRPESQLLEMEAPTYFSKERFVAAGVQIVIYRQRIIQMIINYDGRIVFVKDLLCFTREQLLRRKNFGEKSYEAMRAVLAKDGIILPE